MALAWLHATSAPWCSGLPAGAVVRTCVEPCAAAAATAKRVFLLLATTENSRCLYLPRPLAAVHCNIPGHHHSHSSIQPPPGSPLH